MTVVPTDIKQLILDFHDVYNVMDKRRRVLHQIRYGYYLWMTSMGTRRGCLLYRSEYSAKLQPPCAAGLPYNHEWEAFRFYFKLARFLGRIFLNDSATPAELRALLPR